MRVLIPVVGSGGIGTLLYLRAWGWALVWFVAYIVLLEVDDRVSKEEDA